jgi:high affinity Mn2+ porin
MLAVIYHVPGTMNFSRRVEIRYQMTKRILIASLLVLILEMCPLAARAQSAPPTQPAQLQSNTADTDADSTPVALFPHSDSSRFWISGQANIIFQTHPSFPAAYSGSNSLHSQYEKATSQVYTLFTGLRVWRNTELFADVESAGGRGISDALGLAGFTNLDVVRNPALGATPYLARLMLRQIIPLSSETVSAERGPFALATSLPARRIEIRVGKFSLVDFLDANSAGSDSHLQFMNWTVDNNGAYDYAANTRGYTDGAIVEYDDHNWSLRFAEAMMSKVANGINLDADLLRAHSESYEAEWRRNFLPHRAGVVRVLGYVNHANMGSYRQAINNFLAGETARPDIISTRRQGRVKYGFGLNFEQDLAEQFGIFGRLGWNDGRNESFEYTEVDRTLEFGFYLKGKAWHRANDRAGVVTAINALTNDHARYLALGGLGFLLGDGALTYGPEEIVEAYYTVHLWRGFFASVDLQHINNPGYNQARGPVIVPGVRLHVDF